MMKLQKNSSSPTLSPRRSAAGLTLLLAILLPLGPGLQAEIQIIPAQKKQAEESASNGKPRDPAEKLNTLLGEELAKGVAVQIDAMDRVADLDDKQREELTVASRGAIERSLETWRAKGLDANPQMAQQILQMQQQAGIRGAASMWFGFPGDPTKEAIWVNALGRVLKKDQLQKWVEEKDRREARERKIAVDIALAKLDHSLLLAEEQLSPVRELLDKHLGEQLFTAYQLKRNQPQNNMQGRVFFGGLRAANVRGGAAKKQAAPVPKADLEKILTKTQLEHWPSALSGALASDNQNQAMQQVIGW